MAFRFPLATVLRLRQSVEKREELALQKVLLDIAGVRHQIEQLSAEIALARQAIDKSLQKLLPAHQLQSMLSAMNSVVDRKKATIESLARLERQRAAQMQAYRAAHRDRQMLSDMETRQRQEYDQARARAEQKRLDDIFAARIQRG